MATNGTSSIDAPSDPLPANLTPPPTTTAQTSTTNDPAFQSNSLRDDAKRPRDARLIHMILANAGITSYTERVPLQLMDFAYRYTSSILTDALHLTSDVYGTSATTGATATKSGGQGGGDTVSLEGLRLSVASRTHYQFSPVLPKEFYQEVAQERNRVALREVGGGWGRLPPERYCFTGVGWGIKEEWDSEGDGEGHGVVEKEGAADLEMGEGEAGEEGDDRMEDFFGEDGGEDKNMEDQ